MLELIGRSSAACDGVSRRRFLKAGVLGLAGLGLRRPPAGRGVGRRRAAGAARPVGDPGLARRRPAPARDLRPQARRPGRVPRPAQGDRARTCPGIQVSELLPEHARLMDRMSIIRSMHHDNGDHFAAAHWMLTGYLGSNAVDLPPQYPSAGSIVAKLKGPKTPGMPAYVGLPEHALGRPRPRLPRRGLSRASPTTRSRPTATRTPTATACPTSTLPGGRRRRRGSTAAAACSTPSTTPAATSTPPA